MSVQTHGDSQEQDFATLISGEYDYARPRRGQVRDAVILEIGTNDLVVDLGAKRDGIVIPPDLQRIDDHRLDELKVGDHIPVVVLRDLGDSDGIPVSYSRGLQQEDWLRAERLVETGEIIEATVVDENRGGLLAEFGHLRGFIPNSHLGLAAGAHPDRLQETKSAMVGETLELAVIEVDQRRRRLILSKRAVDRRKRRGLLEELNAGEVRRGVVRSIVDFGAFVDLGGIDGLVHVSELAHHHVAHPSEVLSAGDEVEVYVLDVDQERERISLSRKRLLPDPWDEVTESLQQGDIVNGIATNLVSFGVFVDIGQGIEGLVHTSEIPELDVAPGDLEKGSPVLVRVLNVDHNRKRMSLRLEQAWPAESEGAPEDVGGAPKGAIEPEAEYQA